MTRQGVVALIPARGGSKRLPGKNMLPLGGKPLVVHTIEAALGSKELSDVVVSTDDESIAEAARQCGARVPFMRPPELSGDRATTEQVALHLLEFLEGSGGSVDVLAVLQPTSPFRGARHIDEAIRHLYANAAASLVSVVELDIPRSHLRWVEDGMATQPAGPSGEAYRLNGAIYLVRSERLRATGRLSPDPCAAYVMDCGVSLDIDTVDDFKQAEKHLREVRA